MSETRRHLAGYAWLLPLLAIALPIGAYYGSNFFQGGPQLREVQYTPDSDRGAALYSDHCVRCHGPKGQGDGPMAKNLPKPPRDLIKSDWVKATDLAALKTVIKEGIPAAGMPPTTSLSKSDLEHLAAYTWKLQPRETQKEKKDKEKKEKAAEVLKKDKGPLDRQKIPIE